MFLNLSLSGLLVLAALTIAAAPHFVLAQIAGGMEGTNTRWGGNNFITGTVFWPNGKRVDVRLALRLVSATRSDILSSTDDSGRFVFSHLPAGNYQIIIDGEADYERVAHEVEILTNREGVPQAYSVSIRLIEKRRAATKIPPSVINVEDAGVPKAALDLYFKAGDLARAKDYAGAIRQLEQAVAVYPKFMNAYNEMGVQYMRLNDLEKADAALRAALAIKPDAFEPLVNSGIVLFRMGRHQEADVVLQRAQKAKDSGLAKFYRGRALMKLGKNEDAEAELKLAIELGGEEFKEAHRLLAVIYLDRGDRQRVVDQLEIYLRLVPSAADADELREVIRQNKGAIAPAVKPLL